MLLIPCRYSFQPHEGDSDSHITEEEIEVQKHKAPSLGSKHWSLDLNLGPSVCDFKVGPGILDKSHSPCQAVFFFSSVYLWSRGEGCLLLWGPSAGKSAWSSINTYYPLPFLCSYHGCGKQTHAHTYIPTHHTHRHIHPRTTHIDTHIHPLEPPDIRD